MTCRTFASAPMRTVSGPRPLPTGTSPDGGRSEGTPSERGRWGATPTRSPRGWRPTTHPPAGRTGPVAEGVPAALRNLQAGLRVTIANNHSGTPESLGEKVVVVA